MAMDLKKSKETILKESEDKVATMCAENEFKEDYGDNREGDPDTCRIHLFVEEFYKLYTISWENVLKTKAKKLKGHKNDFKIHKSRWKNIWIGDFISEGVDTYEGKCALCKTEATEMFWMNAVTMSTVGQGDQVPVARLCRIIMIIYSLIGFGLQGHSAGHSGSGSEAADENSRVQNNKAAVVNFVVFSAVIGVLASSWMKSVKDPKEVKANGMKESYYRSQQAMWETLTTVGYGDDDGTPTTRLGMLFAFCIMSTMGGWAGNWQEALGVTSINTQEHTLESSDQKAKIEDAASRSQEDIDNLNLEDWEKQLETYKTLKNAQNLASLEGKIKKVKDKQAKAAAAAQ